PAFSASDNPRHVVELLLSRLGPSSCQSLRISSRPKASLRRSRNATTWPAAASAFRAALQLSQTVRPNICTSAIAIPHFVLVQLVAVFANATYLEIQTKPCIISTCDNRLSLLAPCGAAVRPKTWLHRIRRNLAGGLT